MSAVGEWKTRIRELVRDCSLNEDPRLLTCHEEGRAFLRSELRDGRFHPELGVWIHALAEPQLHYIKSVILAPKKESAAPKTTGSIVHPTIRPKEIPSAKHPETRHDTGVLCAQLSPIRFSATARAFASQEYGFVYTVAEVLRAEEDDDARPLDSRRSSIRKEADALRGSFRKVMIGMPVLRDFSSEIDCWNTARIKDLWPDVERELIWAVAEKCKAKNNPILARLSRLVGAESEPEDSTPDVAAESKGTMATAATRAKKRKPGTPPVYSDAERKADKRRWRRWLEFRKPVERRKCARYRDFHSYCLHHDADEPPADYGEFKKSLMRGKQACLALRGKRGKKSF